MMTREEFISWLEGELKKRGWTMAELSRRGNIAISHLSRVMSGERNAGPTTCQGIARAFHIPAEEVMRRAGVLPRNRRVSEKAEEMRFYFDKLSEEDQERLLLTARAWYEAHPSEK